MGSGRESGSVTAEDEETFDVMGTNSDSISPETEGKKTRLGAFVRSLPVKSSESNFCRTEKLPEKSGALRRHSRAHGTFSLGLV